MAIQGRIPNFLDFADQHLTSLPDGHITWYEDETGYYYWWWWWYEPGGFPFSKQECGIYNRIRVQSPGSR